MKKLALILTLIIIRVSNLCAQSIGTEGVNINELPVVYLPSGLSIHFVSPELIQYVDISTKKIMGDLPVKNVLRIKYLPDSLKKVNGENNDAIVTIAGEKFIAQYHVIFTDNVNPRVQTNIEILPEHTRPLDVAGITLSKRELKKYAMSLIAKKVKGHWSQSKSYGIEARLNHIYTLDDYIFLDLSYLNETNLKYDVDQIRFKIEDRKVTKASTVQSLEILPEFILFNVKSFKKGTRDIYVFKKFSFPGNKLLKVELSEKQISGRVNTLIVKYGDVLDADIVPNN